MRNKVIRFLLVIAFLGGILVVAGQKIVWASPPAPIDVFGDPKTGKNPYKLGGCITGNVWDLKPDYKMNVSLLEDWNSYRTEGLPPMSVYYWTLPGGVYDVFTCVTLIKVMKTDTLLKEFPEYPKEEYSADYPFTKGSAEVCLDTPSDREGYIYYYDELKMLYNKEAHGDEYPNWVLVGGPFPGGTRACVPVTYSGVYGYYSPDPKKDYDDTTKFSKSVTYHKEGSVDVPDYHYSLAKNGAMALGGCVTGNLEDLPENKGYRMDSRLITDSTALKPLPENVGKFYQCIIDLKLYQNDTMIQTLPEEDGNVTICFAIPPHQSGTIYFYDNYYNPTTDWVPVGGAYKTGIACGPVYKTGYYGMVDVLPHK